KQSFYSYCIDKYDIFINDCCRADACQQRIVLLQSLSPRALITVPRVTGNVKQYNNYQSIQVIMDYLTEDCSITMLQV
ncbi:MAG: hypothetical protein K2W88_02490, partial [Pararheinheimera sp.]|nr:hypothetical protein [Rheinheimera sp.]